MDRESGNTNTSAVDSAADIQPGELVVYERGDGGTLKTSDLAMPIGGLKIKISPFVVGGVSFSGGTLTLVANGTWYVGVDLFTQAVIALPRLGHRGWVPVAKVVVGASSIISCGNIIPVIPKSRIPRTLKKIAAGQSISAIVMGSSLTQGGDTTDWPGMLFNPTSSLANYRINNSSAQYRGVGGSPNQYQLAQVGLANAISYAGNWDDSGSPSVINAPLYLPTDRSEMFTGVDLVVLGCLANGGDYRLECIEPIVRKLRVLGVEVIMVTDNPQISTPWTQGYSALTSASLYVDGPEVMRIANLYGCEVADTAAYVLEACMRYPTNGAIYGNNEQIHMAHGSPAGRTEAPSCGHEVWARAIRSVIPINVRPADPTTLTYDFSTGAQGWTGYFSASVDASSGALVCTKNSGETKQWGAIIYFLPQCAIGDKIRVRGTVSGIASSGNISFGMQDAGWASNQVIVAGDGSFDGMLTVSKVTTTLIAFGTNNAAPLNSAFTIDNIIVDIIHTNQTVVVELTPGRDVEILPLPPVRVVTDMRTPGDAQILLPKDEQLFVANDANCGTLNAHPWGTGSFARCFSQGYDSAKDLLVVATGKSCGFAGNAVVGFSIIRYADQNDAACTVDVYRNNTKVKTLTFGVMPFGNEWYTTIFTPTEWAQSGIGSINQITLTVTSGTLKIAAFVVLGADIEFIPQEGINFVGAWPYSENDNGTNTRGRATDTAGDYAWIKCPATGRRIQWLCANRPNSQPVDIYSGREAALNTSMSGNTNFRAKGNLVGSGAIHFLKLRSAAGSPVAGNRSLHISGAIVVNDR